MSAQRSPVAGLAVRIFTAFLLVVAITIAGRLVLPRFGLLLPLWVPVLAFVAIAASAILVAWENRPRDDEADDDDVAGRIGPSDPDDRP